LELDKIKKIKNQERAILDLRLTFCGTENGNKRIKFNFFENFISKKPLSGIILDILL